MGKQNKKKCCKTCVWWQVKKTRPEDEVEGQKVIKETDCVNSRSEYYKDVAYADDCCSEWKEKNRHNMKELQRKERRFFKKNKRKE